jgi:ABC-type uncharacterized transport system auxiliary subunit
MTTLKQFYRTVLVLIVFMLSACLGTTPASQPIYYYTLDYPAPLKIDSPPLPFVLRVDRFSVSPPFDSQRMIYADKGLHRNSYAHHQWVAPPGELAAYLIARDLRAVGSVHSVLTPDAVLEPTHIINGWIEEFIEDDRQGTWRASLCLHITLLDARNHNPAERILFQKTYREAESCRSNSPGALAEAMSIATARASATLGRDVYQRLEHLDTTTP